jgi:hypothetical protein
MTDSGHAGSGRAAPPLSRAGILLARAALLAALGLAVPIVGFAWALYGAPGAAGAGAGLSLVLVLFGGAALLHVWAGRLSPSAWAGAVAAGFGGRLVLYTLVLAALSRVEGLHWPSLAAATAVGFVATLAVELRVLTKHPELFWLRTEGADR